MDSYPPELTAEQTEFLTSEIKGWSLLHGLAVRPPSNYVPKDIDTSGSLVLTAPVTLFPSLIPRSCFLEARKLQKAYNQLYAAIAADEKFLTAVVEELVDVDDFIKNLWDVHLAVKAEGYVQNLSLGIFRSDYMLHEDPSDSNRKPKLRQVEFNTIASSFGGLAAKVSALHRQNNAYPESLDGTLSLDALPANHSIESIATGLAQAHRAYGESKSRTARSLCVLFVVQTAENNIFDQLAISDYLLEESGILSFRLSFEKGANHTTIESENPLRPLTYTPPHSPHKQYEVTTLYFRAGYSPAEYTSADAWSTRLHFERSAAIKCPSILTHLAGSKKIQQILATPESPWLDHFLRDTTFQNSIDSIRDTFTAIFPMDDSEAGKRAIGLASNPETAVKYVLKPQREGGGNNIYGAKIPAFLKSLGEDERRYRGHILMELIEPPTARNSIFRSGQVQNGEVICELGIFGCCLWKHKGDGKGYTILEDHQAGFLLRTKGSKSEEGGVAAGFGSVDSVCLVDS